MKSFEGCSAAGLVLAALAGCCLFPETATLIIQNDSSFEVDEVYHHSGRVPRSGRRLAPRTR